MNILMISPNAVKAEFPLTRPQFFVLVGVHPSLSGHSSAKGIFCSKTGGGASFQLLLTPNLHASIITFHRAA